MTSPAFTFFYQYRVSGRHGMSGVDGDIARAIVDDEARYHLTERLIDSLHTEAMLLADEARAYFDDAGRVERDRLAARDRVLFSCESLKVTTRLMHVVAWLLSRRVFGVRGAAPRPLRPLADPVESDAADVRRLPATAQHLIRASDDLYERVRRLESEMGRETPDASPARSLLGHLERTL